MLFRWSAILLLFFLSFVLLMIAVRALRRARPKVEKPVDTDFSMDELYALFQSGRLSREEFERARDSILRRRTPDSDPRPRGFEVLEPRDHI